MDGHGWLSILILIVILILIENSTTWRKELNMDRQDGQDLGMRN